MTSVCLLVLLIFTVTLSLTFTSVKAEQWNNEPNKWSTIWATAPQLVEPANLPPAPFNISGAVFANSTLRQTVRATLGAPRIRLRFSNTFGTAPFTLQNVTIALSTNGSAGVGSIQEGTSKSVTFNGGSHLITITKASLGVSDPIEFLIKRGQILSISVYLNTGVSGGAVTGHPGSRTDSWITFGNQVADPELKGESLLKTTHWYFISGIEGWVPSTSRYLSILGDSITDGRGSTTNGNDRWPDVLAARLATNSKTSQVATGNQGLGGNCVLSECLGPNALSRIDRDVISQSGIRYAMIFEGVNDIGGSDASPSTQRLLGDSLINAYQQFITRVHAAGLIAIGATITPFGGSFYDEPSGEKQRTRTRINEWIRRTRGGPQGFDAVADFDQAIRDPRNVTALKKEFDSGDGLHPNTAAYVAMVKSFPLYILN